MKEALVDGKGIADFFVRLGEIIKDPITFLKELKESFMDLFNGGAIPGAEGVSNVIERLGERMGMLQTLAEKVGDAWNYLSDRFEGVRKVLGAMVVPNLT